MVYKKFIKKDGKLYGPYIYESKRVDGKVVSEYHGPKKTLDVKRYTWIFISAVLVVFLVYFLSTFNFAGLTGQAILNTEVNYIENEPIQGNLAISLKQGELLPADSKLILENSGQSYEYNLNNLVSNQAASGNFYIDGISLSGAGEGYGIEGERQVYPGVSFVLNIYPANETVSAQPESVANDGIIVVNESNTIINEALNNESVNITEPVPAPVPENIVPETPSETPAPETTTENVNPEITATETSPMTGFFVRMYNFFFALTPTGRAISQGNEITGQTSFGNPFVYDLSGGEGVQLKPGSVFASGSAISDDNVQVKIEGNQVKVETSYSEIEKGYGQEYTGGDSEKINIDLFALGLVLNNGDLMIKIVHGNNEIFSTSMILGSGQTVSVAETISNSTTVNVTIEQPLNETPANFTEVIQEGPQIITADTVQFILTETEKALLAEEFGDIVVKTTKSEIFNNKLIKRYEIGKDWIEYSYDLNLSPEELDYQTSIDRMKWLKDLAQRINISKTRVQQTQPVEAVSFE